MTNEVTEAIEGIRPATTPVKVCYKHQIIGYELPFETGKMERRRQE